MPRGSSDGAQGFVSCRRLCGGLLKVSPYLNLLIGTIAPSKSSSTSRQIILSEDLFNHLAVNVCEAILAALEAVGEGFMVDVELVKDSCLDIMNVDRVFCYVESLKVRELANEVGSCLI